MPVYEYLCRNCGLKFDYLVRSNAETIACPKCKGKKLSKLISNFAFNSNDSSVNAIDSSSSCSSCSRSSCAGCSG